MPALLLAAPVAAALAWWLLSGGNLHLRDRLAARSQPFSGDVNGALDAGKSRRLSEPDEDPWKREELPYDRVPSFTGGEYGGGYGPEQGPGGDPGVVYDSPEATETVVSGPPYYLGPTPDMPTGDYVPWPPAGWGGGGETVPTVGDPGSSQPIGGGSGTSPAHPILMPDE